MDESLAQPELPDLQMIRKLLIPYDDPSLEALCLDHLPAVYDRFSRGLLHDEKINLILDHCRRHAEAAYKLQAVLLDGES